MTRKPISAIIAFLPIVLALTFFQDRLHSNFVTNRAAIKYLSMTLLRDQSVADVAEELSITNGYLSALPPADMTDRWKTIARSLDFVQSQVSMSRLASQSTYRAGLLQQENKQWESAFRSFKGALQTDPAFVPALLSLVEVSERLDQCTDLTYRIERVRNAEPDYAFTVSVQPGLELLGFDVDENAFALTSDVPIVIYWRIVNGKMKASSEIFEDAHFRTYAWADRAIQVGDAKNLISNAGFERFPFMATGFPTSFSRAYTPESVWSPYQLKVQTRQDIQSTVLCLTNDAEHYRTGVTTLPLTVEPGKQYLAAIWVKDDSTSNGSPMIYETRTPGHDNVILHHIPDRLTDDGWHLHADVISVTQPFVRFWMANFDAVGQVCFDNLLLIPLPYPPLGAPPGEKP